MTPQFLTTFSADEIKSMIVIAVTSAINENKSNNKAKSEAEELLTLKEVATLLKKSEVTIHKWKKEGVIPFHRISNKIYFKRNEVLESLQKSKIAGL